MAKRFAAASILSLISLCGCISHSPLTELHQPLTVAFNISRIDRAPADFTEDLTGGGGPVSWIVRNDPTAGGGAMLVQESADDTSYRFPMCIYNGVSLRDVSAEVKFKALAGTTDQAGGIVLRYQRENYYVARANALEDNIDLFKTVNGKRIKIAEAAAKVTTNQWHTLAFSAKGPHLKVTFNGQTAIEIDDFTFNSAGTIGLWTKADSVSAFKELKIEPVP